MLEKVDALRDKIDAGEFDDRSNLGSILNTQMDANENPIDPKEAAKDLTGNKLVSKKGRVTRTEQDLTANISMRHDA